ncbi:MAG: hypothetical protein BroJett040_22640 [Oligoflexia bacterium]|nr:MAG: hypothetical protein BroJett040_22640 [Oligoflexia bacterium]
MNFYFKKQMMDLLKDPTQKWLLIILVAVLFIFGVGQLTNSQSTTPTIQAETESADTHIPHGFVLVPIELQNADALNGIMNGHGVVDLYSQPMPGQKRGDRVGRRLRIIQAPLNPRQYAVLVPEQEAQIVVGAMGPLIAVIQNKDLRQSGEIANHKKINRVQYYGDSK